MGQARSKGGTHSGEWATRKSVVSRKKSAVDEPSPRSEGDVPDNVIHIHVNNELTPMELYATEPGCTEIRYPTNIHATSANLQPPPLVNPAAASVETVADLRRLEKVGMGLDFSPGDPFIGMLTLDLQAVTGVDPTARDLYVVIADADDKTEAFWGSRADAPGSFAFAHPAGARPKDARSSQGEAVGDVSHPGMPGALAEVPSTSSPRTISLPRPAPDESREPAASSQPSTLSSACESLASSASLPSRKWGSTRSGPNEASRLSAQDALARSSLETAETAITFSSSVAGSCSTSVWPAELGEHRARACFVAVQSTTSYEFAVKAVVKGPLGPRKAVLGRASLSVAALEQGAQSLRLSLRSPAGKAGGVLAVHASYRWARGSYDEGRSTIVSQLVIRKRSRGGRNFVEKLSQVNHSLLSHDNVWTVDCGAQGDGAFRVGGAGDEGILGEELSAEPVGREGEDLSAEPAGREEEEPESEDEEELELEEEEDVEDEPRGEDDASSSSGEAADLEEPSGDSERKSLQPPSLVPSSVVDADNMDRSFSAPSGWFQRLESSEPQAGSAGLRRQSTVGGAAASEALGVEFSASSVSRLIGALRLGPERGAGAAEDRALEELAGALGIRQGRADSRVLTDRVLEVLNPMLEGLENAEEDELEREELEREEEASNGAIYATPVSPAQPHPLPALADARAGDATSTALASSSPSGAPREHPLPESAGASRAAVRTPFISGTFEYGMGRPASRREVFVFARRACDASTPTPSPMYLGRHLTHRNGKLGPLALPPSLARTPGHYEVLGVLPDDYTFAKGSLYILRPGTRAVVVDMDGTITSGDSQVVTQFTLDALGASTALNQHLSHKYDLRPRRGALQALRAWAGKGYQIVYLSGRQGSYYNLTLHWLVRHGYPPGPIHLTRTHLPTLPLYFSVGLFKVRYLQHLQQAGIRVHAAYGNTATDVRAYAAAGLPPDRIFMLGRRRSAKTCVSLPNWTAHVPWIHAHPESPVPVPYTELVFTKVPTYRGPKPDEAADGDEPGA